jgi:DNA-binding NarL/FixJ family response regulator
MTESLHILVYTSDPILAIGLRNVIAGDPEIEFQGWCSSLAKFAERLKGEAPDLALVDLTPETTAESLVLLRESALHSNLVLWTAEPIGPAFGSEALAAGVRGILRKTLSPEAHLQCFHRIHAGEFWYERDLLNAIRACSRAELTPREAQLMGLLSRGLKNKEIANALDLAEGTVKVYLSHLFVKCHVRSRLELTLYGRRAAPHSVRQVHSIAANLSGDRGRAAHPACA